jgi:hypothetical protein
MHVGVDKARKKGRVVEGDELATRRDLAGHTFDADDMVVVDEDCGTTGEEADRVEGVRRLQGMHKPVLFPEGRLVNGLTPGHTLLTSFRRRTILRRWWFRTGTGWR